MLDNGCPFINLAVEKPNFVCEKLFLGSLSHGLELAVTYYIDSLEKLFYASNSINNNASFSLNDLHIYDIYIDDQKEYTTDETKNKRWNVLNSQSVEEASKIHKNK